MQIIQSENGLIRICPEDLVQFEQGRLGRGHQQSLLEQRLVFILGTIGFVLLALVLLALLPIYYFYGSGLPGSVFAVGIGFGLLWLFLLRKAPRQWWRINQDLHAGKVAFVDGQVQCSFRSSFGIVSFLKYSLQIGERRWLVSQDLFVQFSNQARYRIFYAPASGVFLGALMLPSPVFDSQLSQNTELREIEEEPSLQLTPRELEILRLIAEGHSNKEIANRLSFSVNTIKMYSSQIYRKLGVHRRTEAIAEARRIRILS